MDDIKEKTPPPVPHPAVLRWFREEEFYWRSLASCIWLVMILPALFAMFLLCINFAPFSPVIWITETISTMFSLMTMSTVCLLQFICILATIPHAKAMSVQRLPHSTNMKFCMFLLRVKHLSTVGLFVSFTFSTTFILKQYCSNNSEYSSFLSLLGLFHGFFYTNLYYKKHMYLAEFPVVPQTRFFRFKKISTVCAQDIVASTLKALAGFYVLHIVYCFFPSGVLPTLITNDGGLSVLGALSIIINVSLLFDCFCVSIVVYALLHISNTLVKIFNTQAYMFPINASSTDDANKTLADAMESTDDLLKHMACLDFNVLSRYQQPRRMEIFELTPPGNQAHCWNRTSTEALKIIHEMRDQLIKEKGRKQESKSSLKPMMPKTVGAQGLFSASEENKPEPLVNTSWIPSPSKLLASITKSAAKKPAPNTSISSPLYSQVSTSVAPSSKPVLMKPAVKEVEPVNLFEKLQPTLWCIEALSNLAAVSLTEDKYGVVQRKLPEILEELLLLLEACEVYWKCLFNVPSSNHSQHVEAAQMNTTHATTLKLASKTGLYTITTAFGYHISSVRLPSDLKKRLHAFLEFAE